MSKKSKSIDQNPDDFADDFDVSEGNSSQPYLESGRYASEKNLLTGRRASAGGGNADNYPMVVLPNSQHYGRDDSPADDFYDEPMEADEDEIKMYRRTRRTYRTVKIFSAILLLFALLGFFVPCYLAIPSSDGIFVTGSSILGSGSPFTVFLGTFSDFPAGIFASKAAVYSWWMLICLVLVLISTVATLFTRRASVVWFCLDCAFTVASIAGYLGFITSPQIVVIDFAVIAAIIAVIAFFVQAIAFGKRGSIIPLICLIAMGFVLVFTYKDDIISAESAIIGFRSIFTGGEVPALYQIMAYVAAALLLLNIVITVLQLCTVRRTTWFSFIRYTIMAVVAIVALIPATIKLQKTVFDLIYLPVFVLVAIVLVILCLIACIHNKKVKARQKALAQAKQEEKEKAESETAVAPVPVAAAATAPAPAVNAYGVPGYTQVPGSNIYININSGVPAGVNVPIMQYAVDPYTTKKVYSDGFVGTVNKIPNNIDEQTGLRKDDYVLPFDYMGESYAIEADGAQDVLPDRTAPQLSQEELESIMSHSSLDSIPLPAEAEEEKEQTNTEYIAETEADSVKETAEGEAATVIAEEEIVTEAETESEEAEATTEETESVETEKVVEESAEESVEETEATEEVSEEPAAEEVEEPEEEEEEIEDDEFIKSLSKEERKEFRAVFLSENTVDFLPAYKVGEDNTLFFNSVFIYLSKIRENISDPLLAAMYAYINS